ncbi:Protein CBG26427 [Caenorhabditis briggsae]|uniref:Uncharacterized protein n=2 Tax=Caenorhabditis briggsae TaxID=6238 RepID=A0AAE9D3I7_CAEBR|nr:Protein CBG26427 [Caenorhabditis briggsae]ULT94265.1 hypothetical protein L3Y34_003618 [Caenorhabditis briggsae]CAS00740.1 Protein CBG26427 [Caenorhabditis briggsae]
MKFLLFFMLILLSVSLALMDSNIQPDYIKNRKNLVARSERIHVTTHRPGDFRPFTGKKTTLKNWFN